MEEYSKYIYYKIEQNEQYEIIKLKENLKTISNEIIQKILIENGFNEDYLGLKKYIKYSCDNQNENEFKRLNNEDNVNFNILYIQLVLNDNKYIYYKINDNSEFYIMEFKKENFKSITKTEMIGFLYNEGFRDEDISLIYSIKYNFYKGEVKKDLKEDKKVKIENHYILYIYLEIKGETKSSSQFETNDYDYYKTNFDELQKKVNELSQDISNRNIVNKSNIIRNQKFSKQQRLQRINGINQNINFEKTDKQNSEIKNNESKGVSSFYLYSYPLVDNYNININIKRDIEVEKKNINKNTKNLNKNKGNENINLIKDDINKKYEIINEDYIYYNQIFTIYNEFKNAKKKANLKIEPINENIEEYLEQGPDILHIKINSIINRSPKEYNDNNEEEGNSLDLLLEVYGNGGLTTYSGEILKIAFTVENNVSKIKLLIFSTQNIEEMEKIFKNIDIQNIIFINSSQLDEKEENNFIKSLYNNLLKGETIKDSFNRSKNEIKDKFSIKLFSKENPKLNLTEGGINLNKNCSLNLDFVNNNYKKVIGRNRKLKQCIIDFKKNKKVCIFGYEGLGKKSFAQKVGYYLYERNIMNNIYYLELYSLEKMSKDILTLKIEEIKINIDDDNDPIGFNNILIIVYLNFIIKKKDELKSLEKIINELDEKFYYLISFTISKEIMGENKKIINFASIELEPFDEINQKKIFNSLLIVKNEETINLGEEILKKTKGRDCEIFKENQNQEKLNKKEIKTIHDSFIKIRKEKNKTQSLIIRDQKEKEKEKEREKEKKKIEICTKGCSGTCPYECPNGCPEKSPNTPNDIYLRALYINLFYNNHKIECQNMSNLKIIVEILKYEKEGINIKKIFSIFSILKFGIIEDSLEIFFKPSEIKFIKKELNYLIFVEKNEKESIYYIDNSYIELIIQILIDKYENILLENLKIILKNYALIFKYLIYNSDFPYNIIMQIHPENEFWHISSNNFNDEYNFKKKCKQLYFDDVVYSNNVFHLFNYEDFKYETIINRQKKRENKENENESSGKETLINNYNEYIYLIAIYLPCILYFKNSFFYKDLILDFFLNSLIFFDFEEKEYEIKLIRLRMLKYLISDDSHLNKIEDSNKKEIIEKNGDILFIFYLIQTFNNKNQKEEISILFEKCLKLIKGNNYYNLVRLNILYYLQTNEKICLEQLENDLYNKINNLYLKLRIKLLRIEDYLKNNEFDEFDIEIKKCEEVIEKNKNDFSLRNSDINIILLALKNQKNKLFKDYIKKKLFFFSSNPFYNEEGKELLTESNNSFYLKYKLQSFFPNLQIEFQRIDKNFKSKLQKCLNDPIKFLYLGSDGFNNDGNIIYEDEFKTFKIKNEDIKKIIDGAKCKESCDVVILGILNNDENDDSSLYNIFKNEPNNFRHIIYIKKRDDLINLFEKEPIFYCFFYNCFFLFIKEFILNLSKSRGYLTIREAFRRANNIFNENLKKIKILTDGSESYSILCLGENPKNSDDICDFGFINDENFDTYINHINSIKKNIKDSDLYDEKMRKYNIYFRKNPFNDEIEKVIEEDTTLNEKMKFLKFPGKYYLKDEQLEKRFFSMKKLLENIINFIKDNQIVNLYGYKLLGKKLCIEISKYFYMNNYFKKGIYIIDLRYFNKEKYLSELKNRIINNKNVGESKSNDILIVLVHVEKIKDNVWKWINDLNVHTLISTNKKFNDDLSLENKEQKENKKDKKNKNEIQEDYKSKIKEKMKFYDIDKKIVDIYKENPNIIKEEEKNNERFDKNIKIMNKELEKLINAYKIIKMIKIK